MQPPRRPLNALAGVTPVLFAGPRAADADLNALSRARDMEQLGADRADIWRETGWFNDAGRWSFESSPADGPTHTIPDMQGRSSTPLAAVSQDPAFAQSYPNLLSIPVFAARQTRNPNEGAHYYPPLTKNNIPMIGILHGESTGPMLDYYMQHEKQHAADDYEGYFRAYPKEVQLPWDQRSLERRAVNAAYRDLYMGPTERRNHPPWETERNAFDMIYPNGISR